MVVEIETGKVAGSISKRALSMVQEWREIHKIELMKDWELAELNKPLNKIQPLG